MNAGPDFQAAMSHAQYVANATLSPRWVYQWRWVWRIEENPPLAVEHVWRVDPE